MKIAMGNIQNGATERRRIVEKNKYIFYFLCVQKVFSSLHKFQITPLMADGLNSVFTWQSMGQSQASWFLSEIS